MTRTVTVGGRRREKGDLRPCSGRRTLPTFATMPLVQDFVPVAERFEQAGMLLVAGRASWLAEVAATAVAPADLVAVEFGAPRSVEHALIAPLHWETKDGPFSTLDADLRLEQVPRGGSHLGFSGTYEMPSPGASSRDAASRRGLIEACVHRFITGVAATLERGGADIHLLSSPR